VNQGCRVGSKCEGGRCQFRAGDGTFEIQLQQAVGDDLCGGEHVFVCQEDAGRDEEAGAVAGEATGGANCDPTNGSSADEAECEVADIGEVISGEDSFELLSGDGGVTGGACDEVAALKLLRDVDRSRSGEVLQCLP